MYYNLKSIAGRIKIGHVIIVWLLVNLVSAAFTLLYSDEAYYFLYSQHLAFGYFDHPPMIALFIRLGSFLTKSETGVRLVSVLAIAAALYLTYELSGVKKPFLFMAVIFSVFALNLLGFMALPDAPLLLFTVLFFVAYKRFLHKENTVNIIFLAFIMATLLYSKYHGILVIFFTLASNIKLLKSPRFLLATFIGFLFFLPHLLWQYENSFVTFSYHLFERSASHYNVSFTIEYILGQILFYGPFTAIFMFVALFRFKDYGLFDKALLWNIWGIFGFFLLSTFKGSVEANWTLPVLVPLLIIFMKYCNSNPVIRRKFYFFAMPLIVIIMLFRIQMIYPVFKINISRIDNLRGQKEFVKEALMKSSGLPIITGSYQEAGIISYYSGASVSSINLNGRKNQFNLWHADDSLRFRKVAYINSDLKEGVNFQNPLYHDYKVTVIDSLPVMNDLVIKAEPSKILIGTNMDFDIKVLLSNGKYYNNYRDAGGFQTRLQAELYRDDSLICEQVCPIPIDLLLNKYNGEYIFRFISPDEKGGYRIFIDLKTSTLGVWSTGKVIGLTIQ